MHFTLGDGDVDIGSGLFADCIGEVGEGGFDLWRAPGIVVYAEFGDVLERSFGGVFLFAASSYGSTT